MTARSLETVQDGMIALDSDVGKTLGFTSAKFHSSWLWKDGEYVWISMIVSRDEGNGNLSALFKAIEGHGWRIPEVERPSRRY